ncbi:cholecystokinin receptor type A-like [Dreissena polymorpha]|uniref:G-protein coupled receptors family 1 profile domain-containing protein n=1 Tax=Dreissena polymorpha TaxID=45954 RepID=A0A9D4SBR4_DREPO|nr:cholecystokinin receptor type A-like [Dreissena polymorpha]XP_052265284.1 cholecystokinin receptor type A-like [Dreissena polymorpha]KAH3897227.1 hypothetical protein DPMN_021413 [Dreissena polymorpha]
MHSNSAASILNEYNLTDDNSTINGSDKYYFSSDLIRREKSADFFPVLMPSFIYTAVLMLFGMPGNLIVVIVYKFKMAKTTSRHFIIALAVFDFINCAFGMPVELWLLTNFYNFDHPILCKLSRFSTFTMNNASTCVLIGIAVDRFRRVCMPLRPNMTVKHSKIMCISFAVISVILAIPALFIYNTKTIPQSTKVNGTFINMDFKTCYVVSKSGSPVPLIFSSYLFVIIILMILSLTIMYALIGRVVCSTRQPDRSNTNEHGGNKHFIVVDNTTLDRSRFSTRLMRSLSHYSPNFSTRQKSPGNASPLRDIIEPLAAAKRSHSDLSMRRHGGREIRAGRTTLILFIVTLVFVLSFVPYLALTSIRYISPEKIEKISNSGMMMYHFALRSYLLNSAVNPLIYCFLNRKFREKVKLLFKSVFCRCCMKN